MRGRFSSVVTLPVLLDETKGDFFRLSEKNKGDNGMHEYVSYVLHLAREDGALALLVVLFLLLAAGAALFQESETRFVFMVDFLTMDGTLYDGPIRSEAEAYDKTPWGGHQAAPFVLKLFTAMEANDAIQKAVRSSAKKSQWVFCKNRSTVMESHCARKLSKFAMARSAAASSKASQRSSTIAATRDAATRWR